MNSKQEAKLKMYLMLKAYLNANPEITIKLPNYNEFRLALDAALLQIQSNGEQQLYNTRGFAVIKNQAKVDMIVCIADNSRKIQAFAKYSNDGILLAETKYLESSLKQMSEIDLLNSGTGLHSRIESRLSELTIYNLNGETQTAFNDIIEAYKKAIPQIRQKQLDKKEYTLLETQGYQMADSTIENINSIVDIVRLSEPTFYAGYVNARKIMEYGTSTIQVQGCIIDSATLQPIVGANLAFRLSEQPDIILEKQSAAKGGYMIKSLPEAIYDVTISKMGYQPQTISATVTITELCVVSAKLVRI